MEESTRAHACKYTYDNIHKMPIRDTAMFQRSYGNVKLTSDDEEETLDDKYGLIIDDIEEDNENLFLTRERNNFDLINLDSSHNSLSKKCVYAPGKSIPCFIDTTNEKNPFCDSFHNNLVPENFDGETKECNLEAKEEIANDLNLNKSNKMCSNGDSTSIDSINEYDSHRLIEIDPCSSLKVVVESATDKHCSQNYKILDSKDTTIDFRDLKSVGSIDEKEEYSLPFHGIRNKNGAKTEDVDSDDSYKWNKKMNDTAYNARYFYKTEYQISNITNALHEDDDKQNLSEGDAGRALLIECQNLIPKTDSAPGGTMISRDDSFSDIIDNDSIDSEDTFRSTSSEFESAMSSNDMMSPFGSPRNSFLKNITDSGSGITRKNKSINFTSFTSENIPKTLNRIGMHKVDKIVATVPQNKIDLVVVDKSDRLSNQNIASNKNVHRSQSIRKLLNLTSQKKLVSSTRKESLNDNQKESQKLVCLNNKDKKINLKELYASKRTKVPQPLFPSYDGDKANPRKMTTCSVEVNGHCCEPSTDFDNVQSSKCVATRTCKINSVSDEIEKEKLKVDSQNVIPPRDQHRFVSKIPRPVSKRELRPKSVIPNIHKSFAFEKNVNERHSNNFQLISKLDKTETISRPSDGSESSYKATLSKLKEEKTNSKNGSKLHINSAKIVSIRSKYWMKEDKVCFSSFGSTLRRRDDKKPDIKKDDVKQNKSNVSLTPQAMRQGSRLAYGKMVRVKTAPIKSAMQLREKMVKEPSKPDTAFSQIKSSRIPSKVVSIGALDVNKIH